MKTSKLFETWQEGDVQFLALHLRHDMGAGVDNVWVIDDLGNNYGGWTDAASFRETRKQDRRTVPGEKLKVFPHWACVNMP
jgi:hypothetical protein